MKYKILFVIFGILIISSAYIINANLKKELKSNGEIICNNLELKDTAECLNKELKTFYKYNISNMGKNLDEDTLKKEGGVCKNYAGWIKKRFLELGAKEDAEKLYIDDIDYKFYVKQIALSSGNESAHVIIIASNKEGYCLFSNNIYDCWEFVQ